MQLFKKRQPTAALNDSDTWQIASSDTTVRTIKAVGNYRRITTREIEQLKKQIEQRKMDSKNWQAYLELCAQWESIDVDDTKSLQLYYSQLSKFMVEKQGAIAAKQVAQERLRLPQANMQLQLEQSKQEVDAAIAALKEGRQKTREKNGWEGNK